MPTKRRQRNKGKTKNVKKKGIPSEEMDSQSTQDSAEGQEASSAKEMSIILNRLSKKRLLNSSSEASDHAQKENIPSRLGDPYDADLETTDAASTGESDMEFSSSQNKKVLSPSKGSNSRTTGQHKAGKKTSRKNDSVKEVSPGNTDSNLSLDISVKHRFPKLYASDTSTPQSVASESKSELNDSAFGFEHLASPKDLPFSPVPTYTPDLQHSISSTTSGISSLQGSQISTSMSMSTSDRLGQKKRPHTVNLSCLVDSDGGDRRKMRKKRPGAQNEKQRAEDWALKIGEEFNDIEMHELSVE